jgi:hypothetical protein
VSVNRRELLKYLALSGTSGVIATTGVENLARSLMPSGGAHTLYSSIDTFEILKRMPWMIKAGIYVPEEPSAMAMTAAEDSVVITIKVLNHIHTPLCFKLDYTGSNGANRTMTQKISSGTVATHMVNAGVELDSDIPRWEKLKLNKWFADILNTGMAENGARSTVINEGEIGPFPDEEDVAIQAFLGVNQTSAALNHSFENTTLPASTRDGQGGDINYHLAMNNIIRSPLGVTALTMTEVETTDSIGRVGNRVVSNNLKDIAADGQAVEKYVSLLGQTIGIGFIDEGLMDKFDNYVGIESELRVQMALSRPEIKKKIADLRLTAEAETAVHDLGAITDGNNLQAFSGSDVSTSKQGFIAQCLFASRVLEIPGKPLRNFSLLLNIKDIDGAGLDTTSVEAGSQPLSYIEGMRQLAIGMNLLSHTIKKHKNVYVVVISEGGRSSNLADNKVSHAFVMGPGGKGGLADHLYANNAAMGDSTNAFNADPNAGSANNTGIGLAPYDGGELKDESGSKQETEFADAASVLNGVVKHIEKAVGSEEKSTAGLGNYVALKTK